MNLDELQSVQSRERQATSLQNLRSSFYQDAGEFIQELERERDRAAERADDPFSSPEVRRLTDDIETAKQTVEAIYERRVGKVVKMASIAAADMPTDEEGLTDEEADLFETLVERIKRNRSHVLEEVLEGEGSDISCTRDAEVDSTTSAESPPVPGMDTNADTAADSTPSPTNPERGSPAEISEEVPPEEPPESPPEPRAEDAPGTGSVNAADMMAGANESDSPPPPEAAASDPKPTEEPPSPASPSQQTRAEPSTGGEPEATNEASEHESESESESVSRATVRITKNIGEIFGVDERSYDLSSDDVVTLPEANAEPLLQRDAAERLD